MRRIITTLFATLAVIVALGVAAVAFDTGGDPVTRPRLERSLSTTFAHQYVQEAGLLGRTGVSVHSLKARTMCDRHGPDVPDVGAGSDWICLISWHDPNVPMPDEGYGKFEVTVHSNDCYTASAPSKLVGFSTLTDKRGRTVTNPAAEFDGCFDPNGDNTPTGTSFPSLLTVTSAVLRVDATNHTGVQVTCGTGAEGCAGSVEVSDGKHSLGTIHYQLDEEESATLPVKAPVPADATRLDFTFTTKSGVGPTDPETIDVQR